MLNSKFRACCHAGKPFLPPKGRADYKGQGWALHLGFLVQAWKKGCDEVLTVLDGIESMRLELIPSPAPPVPPPAPPAPYIPTPLLEADIGMHLKYSPGEWAMAAKKNLEQETTKGEFEGMGNAVEVGDNKFLSLFSSNHHRMNHRMSPIFHWLSVGRRATLELLLLLPLLNKSQAGRRRHLHYRWMSPIS